MPFSCFCKSIKSWDNIKLVSTENFMLPQSFTCVKPQKKTWNMKERVFASHSLQGSILIPNLNRTIKPSSSQPLSPNPTLTTEPQILNPKPHPYHLTLNPKPETLHPTAHEPKPLPAPMPPVNLFLHPLPLIWHCLGRKPLSINTRKTPKTRFTTKRCLCLCLCRSSRPPRRLETAPLWY